MRPVALAAALLAAASLPACRGPAPSPPERLPSYLTAPDDPQVPPEEPPALVGWLFGELRRRDLEDGTILLRCRARTRDGAAFYEACEVERAAVVGHPDWDCEVAAVPLGGRSGEATFEFRVSPAAAAPCGPLHLWILTWVVHQDSPPIAHTGARTLRRWEEQVLPIPAPK